MADREDQSNGDSGEEQDNRYNPGELHAAEQFPTYAPRPNDSAKSDGNPESATSGSNEKNSNIQEAKHEEDEPWANKVSGGDSGGKSSGRASGFIKGLRKRSPLILIIGTILGGGSILTLLFSPATLLLQMRNTLLDKFNDQVTAMDVRSIYILQKKIDNDITSGSCGVITLRCKLKTMSSKQVEKLEKAGFTVNGKTTLFGTRMKAESFTYEGKEYAAKDLKAAVKNDPSFRRALMKGYNPRFAAFSDAIFQKFADKVKITKERNIDGEGKSKEQMNQQLVDAASGDAGIRIKANVDVQEDSTGHKTFYDTSKSPPEVITEEKYNDILKDVSDADLEIQKQKELKDIGKSTAKGSLKKILTSTALGLGAVDSACSGYTIIRAAAFAGKWLGKLQLARGWFSFANSADSITALAAQPSVIQFWGEKLQNSPNSQGQTATDAGLYKNAAYGDINVLPSNNVGTDLNITGNGVSAGGNNAAGGLNDTDAEKVSTNEELLRYVVGQTMQGTTFGSILQFIGGNNATTEKVDAACKFVKSGWGQTIIFGTAIVGAVIAFFSGGATLGWGIAVQTAVNIALGIAIATLTPKLVAIAAGRVINGGENSNEVGNYLSSGAAASDDFASQTRGLPATTPQQASDYGNLTADIQQQYAAVDRLNRSPFDPTSKNTFLGSIVSNFLPYSSKLSTVGGGVLSTLGVAQSSLLSLISPVSRAIDNSPAQFTICPDSEYRALNIATTAGCSIKHGLSAEALAIDPEEVQKFMEPYADLVTGDPLDESNPYGKYLENCIDRSVSIGAYTEENSDTGEQCIQGNGPDGHRNTMFSLFYLDNSVIGGMDDEVVAADAPTTDTGTVTPTGVWKTPATFDYRISNRFGPNHTGIDLAGRGVFSSACDGTIRKIGMNGNNDSTTNIITIDCGSGIITKYMHYYISGLKPGITEGATVTAGQPLADVGTQGNSTGYHLHFQVEQNGTIIDPAAFMQKMGVSF